MSQYLSVDNIIGVQPTTNSSTNLQAGQLDVYNGTTNFHRITSSSGSQLMGITIPNASGTLTVNTATQTLTNKMNHSQVGSASDPSYSFSGNTNLGFFRSAANTIGITCAGVQRASISDTLFSSLIPVQATIFQATSGTFPVCAFTNSTNNQTGLYFGTTTTCAISCNGNTKMTFGSSSNTSFQQITIPDGSYASPSLNFSSYSSTGLVAGGGGTPTLYIVTNGSIRAQFNQNGNYFPVQIQGKDGASNDPSFSWGTEQNSGWYRKGTNDLRCSVASSDSLGIQQNGILLYGSTAGNNASYVPSKLGYYEELADFTLTWNWGSTQANGLTRITRIGRQVFFQSGPIDFATVPSSSAQWFWVNGQVPTRFRPNAIYCFATAWVNQLAGGSDYDTFSCFIDTAGNLTCYQRAFIAKNQKMYVNGFSGSWTL